MKQKKTSNKSTQEIYLENLAEFLLREIKNLQNSKVTSNEQNKAGKNSPRVN